MEISTSLSTKSISNAIKELEKAKRKLENNMLRDFLNECSLWFIHRANAHLDKSDIGRNIVEEIKSGWHWEIIFQNNYCKSIITNESEHASFVEFGVGMIGKDIPHPNAPNNYQYNVDSPYKLETREGYPYWVFPVLDEEDVDMHKGYLAKGDKWGRTWIITKGSWREMYAFNTLLDLKNEPQVIKGLWKKVKQKHWG